MKQPDEEQAKKEKDSAAESRPKRLAAEETPKAEGGRTQRAERGRQKGGRSVTERTGKLPVRQS